jgi:hypothetical protein
MIPTLENECSQFVKESFGFPLLKNLPSQADGFRKVKVRKKKMPSNNDIIEVFNSTFTEHNQLLQRSIFAHGISAFIPAAPSSELEPFYIFPTDGYKFMYSENVHNTTLEYQDTLTKLIQNYGESGIKTFKEVLKYQYTFTDLACGLSSNSEIIVYNIPYYYAIRASLIEKYSDLFNPS